MRIGFQIPAISHRIAVSQMFKLLNFHEHLNTAKRATTIIAQCVKT